MKHHTNKRARRDSRRASVPHGGRKSRKDREIARLRLELAAERRKNADLERKLTELRSELRDSENTALYRFRSGAGSRRNAEGLRDASSRRASRYRKNSFLRYLWEAVMESPLIVFMAKLLQYFRRIRVLQIMLSIVTAVVALAAVAVLSAAMLPFLLFGTALLTMAAALRSRHMNGRLRRELAGMRIRILIPAGRNAFSKNAFFIRNARSMAVEEEVAVVVVSPFLLSTKGFGGRGAYFTARKEGERLFVVRKHYFFFLRRRVLDTLDGDITVVY